jgi:4-hydroxybenzoate polyprenyltransferase
MVRLFKFIVIEIIYNGHLQSLGAMGIVYISSVLAFAINPSIILLILVYLVFQFIYFFDRFRDIRKDASTNKERTAHLKAYLNKIPVIMAVILSLVVVGNLIFGNILSLVCSLLVMFLGAMYPVCFKRLTKKIFMFKNIYVGSVHALLVFYPLIYYHQNPSNPFALYVLFILILIEAILGQIALDTKDILSDKKEKLLTLSVVIGKEKTIKILQILSLISTLTFLYLGFTYNLKSTFYVLLISGLVINQYISYKIKKSDKKGVIVAAAKFFLWFCVGLTANIIL